MTPEMYPKTPNIKQKIQDTNGKYSTVLIHFHTAQNFTKLIIYIGYESIHMK